MITPTKGLKYVLNEDGKSYSCIGFGNAEWCETVTIAAHYNGKPVTTIKESAFSYATANNYNRKCILKSVVIPRGITRIEAGAFDFCYSLKKIELPDGLKFIGSDAFEHCGNLREIIIPESVEVIECAAFLGCRGTAYCAAAHLSDHCAHELDGCSIVIMIAKITAKIKTGTNIP